MSKEKVSEVFMIEQPPLTKCGICGRDRSNDKRGLESCPKCGSIIYIEDSQRRGKAS